MRKILTRVGAALAAGGAAAAAAYAHNGGDVRAAVTVGLSTAIPLIVYGVGHVTSGSQD